MPRLNRRERAAVARATAIAAAHYGVFRPLLWLPTRCELKVATARQVAMYLAHVMGQVPLGKMVVAFKRDAATITHNLRKIEDLRDEGTPFDAELTQLEERFANGAHPHDQA